MSATATTPSTTTTIALPKKGMARVKNVLSGDTVVLLGKAISPNQPSPEVIFTMERLSSPRLASTKNPIDEPGAFTAREWLRRLVVGKQVRFETAVGRPSPGAPADRVYGSLFVVVTAAAGAPDGSSNGSSSANAATGADSNEVHLNVECVRQGWATPRAVKLYGPDGIPPNAKDDPTAPPPPTAAVAAVDLDAVQQLEHDYEQQLIKAYREAVDNGRGIHATSTVPLVRTVKNAPDDVATMSLVEACQKHATNKRILVVVEHVFDGTRMKCQIIDDQFLTDFRYTSFTLLLAGITSPRTANPRADPPTVAEPMAEEAKQFVTLRLLQREIPVSLLGTDKSGAAAVGTVHHPRGNIAVELLKVGLARMTDWSVRLMPPGEVPPLRVAENNAKRTLQGIWHSYAPPVLSGASEMRGTVLEVLSGDTVLILPDGKAYDSEDVLFKMSLASIRAPRAGNERAGRADEPFAAESKDRLKQLTIGKEVKVDIHYERDIPVRPGVNEKRSFGTISVPGKVEDVAEILIMEGLAVTQRHRDEDEKSPRYIELLSAEGSAKAAKKGMHHEKNSKDYKPHVINDLTEPRKAKAYSGSLMRAGKIKAEVDYVFNGGLFKLLVPAENCYIRFAPTYIRCPQPSPSPGSTQPNKKAEPFGDEAKRHARLHTLQRPVEIICNGVTNSGVITGSMFIGVGAQRRDYSIELLGAGLGTIDPRKLEYGEAPKTLIDAMTAAQENKVGIWSLEDLTKPAAGAAATNKKMELSQHRTTMIRLSEIRSGTHFFYHLIGDDGAATDPGAVMEESMKLFTQNHGTAGAPCDAKVGRYVAALFDDGTGKSWYRAKILERKGPTKISVLFIDHGNVSVVPVSTHLRPLDMSLSVERIPAIAKEAVLALTVTRPIETDEGVDAARMLQGICWGKPLTAHLLAPDDSGKQAIAIASPPDAKLEEATINCQMVYEGLARAAKPVVAQTLASRMTTEGGAYVTQLANEMQAAQEAARKSRSGMWRYGDIGDDEDEDL